MLTGWLKRIDGKLLGQRGTTHGCRVQSGSVIVFANFNVG